MPVRARLDDHRARLHQVVVDPPDRHDADHIGEVRALLSVDQEHSERQPGMGLTGSAAPPAPIAAGSRGVQHP
jgi:hypothetical protein